MSDDAVERDDLASLDQDGRSHINICEGTLDEYSVIDDSRLGRGEAMEAADRTFGSPRDGLFHRARKGKQHEKKGSFHAASDQNGGESSHCHENVDVDLEAGKILNGFDQRGNTSEKVDGDHEEARQSQQIGAALREFH